MTSNTRNHARRSLQWACIISTSRALGWDRTCRGHGFTLIELVTSLAISTLLIAALGSAVMVASAALPTPEAEAEAKVASQLDWITIELSEAETIKTATGAELTFTVPDRSGNGQPELISYTWDGNAGSPLYRTYNANSPEVVVASLDGFTVSSATSSYLLGVTPDIKRQRVDRVSLSVLTAGAIRAFAREVALPNAPPVLDLWVRTDFDSDPTIIDRDHSGDFDWYYFSSSGGTFNPSRVKNGWWDAEESLGVRSPGMINAPLSAATRITIKNEGEQAILTLVIEVSNYTAATIRLTARKKKSSTDLLLEQLTGSKWSTLHSDSVPSNTLDLLVVTEPVSDTITLTVNGNALASKKYSRNAFGVSGAVLFGAVGTNVSFDWFDVRVGGERQ